MEQIKLPSAIDIERAVIGALLSQPSAFEDVVDILDKDMFYEPKYACIYESIFDLNNKGESVDFLSVINNLEASGRLDYVGGRVEVMTIHSESAGAVYIENHARIIQQKAKQRQAYLLFSEGVQKSVDNTNDIQDVLDSIEKNISDLSSLGVKSDFVQVEEPLVEAFEEIQKASANTTGISGIPTGFEDIDRLTNGWQRSDLIIIGARPAMGKTALLLSMAERIALNYGNSVGVFSLEMSKVQLVKRMLSSVCKVDGNTIKSGQLSAPEWESLDKGFPKIQEAPLYIDDTPSLSIFEFRSKARRMVNKHGVKIIFIDYLQLMTAPNIRNRQEEISFISRTLKAIAKDLDIPIVALSQLNRGVENRDGLEAKRPHLADLRESGAIEQDADIVAFIHRPEYYNLLEDEQGRDLRGIGEIIIAKHRNGSTGDVRLKFVGKYIRFEELDENISYPIDSITEDIVPQQDNSCFERNNPLDNLPF